MLYITIGLGEPLGTTTTVLTAVACGYIVAALVAGRVGDRFGLARTIFVCSIVYGLGICAGGLAQTWHSWYLPVVFLVTIAGGGVMTLAWGLLFKLMPERDRGAVAGLATWTKGRRPADRPLAAGAAIDISAPYLEATQGYQVLWPILGIPILLVIPLVASLARHESATHGGAAVEQAEAPDLGVDDVDGADGPR